MITNERQYKATLRQAEKFRNALRDFNEIELIKQGIDPIIISAQQTALAEQLDELQRDIAKYDELRSGEARSLVSDDVADLGNKLIEARIARGLSQRDLAARLDMKEQQIQRYEQERYRTANLARIAEVAAALELFVQTEFAILDGSHNLASLSALYFDASKLPVREMVKRGWIDANPKGDKAEAAKHAAEFVMRSMHRPRLHALHKQIVRTGSEVDEYALLAWKSRILQKAEATGITVFEYPSLGPLFIRDLVKLSREDNGPILAIKMLRDRGVAVVFEEHLQGTHLDGAAMLMSNGTPVIGLTLRHDRLDNFWFVLLHEIAHIVCHRDQGLREGFFDDESAVPLHRVEQEADDFAQNALLPMEAWMNSFVRFSKSRSDIREFAEKHGVSPAIVSGRIRRERKDYTMFGDLVGQGRVRSMIAQAGLMGV